MLRLILAELVRRVKAISTPPGNALFGHVYGLSEKVRKEDKEYPAEYLSTGEYIPLKWDTTDGIAYSRIDGEVVIETEESDVSIDDVATGVWPMRLVCFHRKNKTGKEDDHAYTADELVNLVSGALRLNEHPTLQTQLSLYGLEVKVTGWESGERVFNEEFANVTKRPGTEWLILKIRYTITARGLARCFFGDCGEIPDAPCDCNPVTINNTVPDTLGTADEGETFVVGDSTIRKSDLVAIGTTPATVPFTVPDSRVSNSDDTYDVDVKATDPLELPDILFTDSGGGAPIPVPAQTNIVATPCVSIATATCVQLNDPTTGLTQTQRDFIQKVSPPKTGQTVSYAANDDGDLELGRQVDFLTLTCNNPNGNTSRFTDNGDQTVTDWLHRKMWSKTNLATDQIWTVAITTAEASVLGGHTDWHLPNIMEYFQILNFGSVAMLNYAPFNTIANFLWSSTTVSSATTAAYGAAGNFGLTTGAKSGSQFFMICRNI